MRELTNVLECKTKEEFYEWLSLNGESEQECWIAIKRGRPVDDVHFWYLDAVEAALCFGWIDSTTVCMDGIQYNRFSKRAKGSPWTELNKERVRRLEKLGLMTDAGRTVLPPMGERSFHVDKDIEDALKKARVWTKFRSFPKLYQRVRAYNLYFYKSRNMKEYGPALAHLITETRKGKMFGEWNDYGRLLDY